MGYTTTFEGTFTVSGNLTVDLIQYINRFNHCRHTAVDVERFKAEVPDYEDYGFNGDLGSCGEFIIYDAFDHKHMNEFRKGTIDDYNPNSVKSFYCRWGFLDTETHGLLPLHGMEKIIQRKIDAGQVVFGWDLSEKFYSYVAWLKHIAAVFLEPSGVKLNGVILAMGEDLDDARYIVAKENDILAIDAFEFPEIKKILESFCSSEEVGKVFRTPEELLHRYDCYGR